MYNIWDNKVSIEPYIIYLFGPMQPAYQYQPISMPKVISKPPNFLNSKLLDKSAPIISPPRQYYPLIK